MPGARLAALERQQGLVQALRMLGALRPASPLLRPPHLLLRQAKPLHRPPHSLGGQGCACRPTSGASRPSPAWRPGAAQTAPASCPRSSWGPGNSSHSSSSALAVGAAMCPQSSWRLASKPAGCSHRSSSSVLAAGPALHPSRWAAPLLLLPGRLLRVHNHPAGSRRGHQARAAPTKVSMQTHAVRSMREAGTTSCVAAARNMPIHAGIWRIGLAQ